LRLQQLPAYLVWISWFGTWARCFSLIINNRAALRFGQQTSRSQTKGNPAQAQAVSPPPQPRAESSPSPSV
jgi:hypothetical protein